jgi:hypothetical protein
MVQDEKAARNAPGKSRDIVPAVAEERGELLFPLRPFPKLAKPLAFLRDF